MSILFALLRRYLTREGVTRIPVTLVFSARYDSGNDIVVVGIKEDGTLGGPAIELSIWQALSVRDMIDAAIGDAIAFKAEVN